MKITKEQFRYLLSAPFIYGMGVALVLFHISIEIYHRVAFKLYGIPYVDMKQYFIFDRHKKDLEMFEKINCVYCEYGNGLMSYSKDIVGKTEKFWCPLKHNVGVKNPHNEYNSFMDYDIKDFNSFMEKREDIRKS